VQEAKKADGWVYSFDDDPLAAVEFGAADARLTILQHAMRSALIRPRTSFVTEMLKSVEVL
jgi:hypothetical protein